MSRRPTCSLKSDRDHRSVVLSPRHPGRDAPWAQIHILPQRLDKLTLVGTTTIFFAFMSEVKIVPYFVLGQFSARNFATSLVLLPLAVAANCLGIWLVRRTPTERFYQIACLLMFLISLALLWQGWSGLRS